jgi:hypothetical protein
MGLDTKVKAQVEKALTPFAQAFEDSDAFTLLIIGELRTSERSQKVIDGGETVKVRLITAQPVTGEAAHHVRRAARAAWAARNMRGAVHEGGNLFADGQAIDLDPSAIEHLAGLWSWEEYSRIKVGVEHWLEALRKLANLNPSQTSPDRYAADLKVIVDGLQATLDASPEQPDAPEVPEFHALTDHVESIVLSPEQAKARAEELIEDAQIVCGAVLTVSGPGGLGFLVACQLDEHGHDEDHAGMGEDGESYQWPNPAPPIVEDEPQAGGQE